MKNRKRICALLLAGVMSLGMGTVVFAEEGAGETPKVPTIGEGTVDAPITEVPFTKYLELAEGITVPDVTFEFEVTAITPGAPDATIDSIAYTDEDDKGKVTDGKYSIEKNGRITFASLEKVGAYEYTVTETTGRDPNVTYSDRSYLMTVYVANGENGDLYIQSVTAAENGVKQDIIGFKNIYTKNNADLSITKKVEGDFAEQTKEFTFRITMTKSGTAAEKIFAGKIGKADFICKSGVETEFTLCHGQTLVFENIPAGTRYKVEEVAATDGYTPSVRVIENGVEHTKSATSEDQGLTTEAEGKNDCLVGEGKNSVVFTNTYNDVALTGVIMNNLPFILLIGIGICALGMLVISKKRRTAKC